MCLFVGLESRFIAEQIAIEMYPEAKYVEFVEVY